MMQTWTIELLYTPWATASPELRATVAGIFRTLDLPIAREATTPGGEDRPLPPGISWAPTHLDVRVAIVGEDDVYGNALPVQAEMWRRLGEAGATIRRTVPALPLGVLVVSGGRTYGFALQLDDPSDDVKAGITALPAVLPEGKPGTYGWLRAENRWMKL
jgi:hypothetical protein